MDQNEKCTEINKTIYNVTKLLRSIGMTFRKVNETTTVQIFRKLSEELQRKKVGWSWASLMMDGDYTNSAFKTSNIFILLLLWLFYMAGYW